MTAYTKIPVGNNLFVIEWELTVSGGVADSGDTFEAEDAIPLSLHANAPSGVFVKMDFGNISGQSLSMQISGIFGVPASADYLAANSTLTYSPKPSMPPPSRFWTPQASASPNNGVAKIAILFKEA